MGENGTDSVRMAAGDLESYARTTRFLNDEKPIGAGELYWRSAQQLPDASKELLAEALEHKAQTALHVGGELATSLAVGAGIGYIVPAKGPAAAFVGAAFTIPMVLSAYHRLGKATGDLQKPGANADLIAHALARDTVAGTTSFAVNLAGGYVGTAGGIALARSNTSFGRFSQWEQRHVMRAENETLLLTARLLNRGKSATAETATVSGSGLPGELGLAGVAGKGEPTAAGQQIAAVRLDRNAPVAPNTVPKLDFGFLQRSDGRLSTRVNQFARTKSEAVVSKLPKTAAEPGLQMYFGSTHGHSRYSDGMGLPVDLYKKAASQGQQVTTITDHNHLAARDGIKPGDPRANDQAGTPILAEAPEHYTQTQLDAAATTVPGVHVSLFGIEMGTTGSAGHTHGGHGHGDAPTITPKVGGAPAGTSGAPKAGDLPTAKPEAKPAEAQGAPTKDGHDHAPAKPAEAQVPAAGAKSGDSQVSPAPAKPGDAQVPPASAKSGDAQVPPAPEKPGDSQVPPAPAKPGDSQVPQASTKPGDAPGKAMEVSGTTDGAKTPEAALHDPLDNLRESLRRTQAGKLEPQEIHVTGSFRASNLAPGETPNLMPVNWKFAQLDSLAADHLGGVNHINLLEVPTFFEAVRQPKTKLNAFFASLLGKDTHVVKKPDIVKYNDGDYKALVGHLDAIKDSEGKPAVITLNHPRFLADNNPALPADARGRDFGRKSFTDDNEWRSRFVKPYVRGIELIKGGALNPNPVDKIPTGMIDVKSYVGYLGLGVEAGPVFGRDFHFGDPVGNPGSTGFLAKSLDRAGVLDAMRERRTIATTNAMKLNGHMVANDKFPMGSILDQNAVPDVTLKMKMGGQIEPEAQYTFKLYADEKVLDGTDAAVIQTKSMTGRELAQANNEVSFDQVHHKLGNNSLYFTEVSRQDTSGTDRMWTSPIWVQPLAGAKHGVLARTSAGSAAQILPGFDSSPKRTGP